MLRPVLFFIIFLSCIMHAQELSLAKIDTLQIHKQDLYFKKGEFAEGIEFNKKIIQLCEKNNYSKGKARGYVFIAQFLYSLGRYNEGMEYLQKAEDLNEHDDTLQSLLFAWYGKYYYILGFIEKSNQNYNNAADKALNIKNAKQKRRILHFIYGNKAKNFEETKNNDSLYFYTHKAYSIFPKVVEAVNLSEYFLSINKNSDSVKFYLDRAKNLLEKPEETFDYMVFYHTAGNYYSSIGNYKVALECYEKSLEASIKMKSPRGMMKTYYGIYNIYRLENDITRANEYLLKYTRLRDSLNENHKIGILASEKKIIKDEKKQYQKSKNKLYYILQILILFCLTTGLFTFLYYRKNRKKENLLKESDKIIDKKNEEVEDLKTKVNEAFDRMLLLAKTNDPSFITRFQELYPEFYNKLLSVNPNLNIAELTLCAMIWLGFSSKDIASYTFITPKSVEMKKYRLRKRLDLEEQKNLYLFLKNL